MELNEVIKKRRSIRSYKQIEIDRKIILNIVECIKYAPSSMNGQPWKVLIIENKKIKEQIANIKNKYIYENKRSFNADFIKNAPYILILCVDKSKCYNREVENCSIATTYILLKTSELGLGSVFICAYREDKPELQKELQFLLNLPENILPMNIIPVGIPDEVPKEKELKDLNELLI